MGRTRRGLISACGLLALLATAPLSAQAVANEVVWPSDLAAPREDRVAGLADALGIEVDYWTYAESSGLTPGWILGDPPRVRSSDAFETERGDLIIYVVRDGTIATLRVAAERRTEEVDVGVFAVCSDGLCTYERSSRTVATDRVRPEAFRVGVRFDTGNRLVVEGPPGTFSAFGGGVDGLRNLSAHIGFPVERIDWADPDATHSAGHGWWILPEVEEVDCACWAVSFSEDDNITGTASLEAVFAGNDMVQVAVRPWLEPGYLPAVNETEAVRLARVHLAGLGFDRWEARFGIVPEVDHTLQTALLPEHGVVWRIQVVAEASTRKALFEVAVDAEDGGIVRVDTMRVMGSGYRHTSSPDLWDLGLVFLVVFALTRRWGR